jgi:hypothetical protein
MTWRGRIVLGIPFAIAATLNLLAFTARPLHWNVERIGGYCFLFGMPWLWLLDNGWIGSVSSKWLETVIAYSIILWVPALLHSACLWLVIWASKAVRRRVRRYLT